MATDSVWWEIVHIQTNIGYPDLKFEDEDEANWEASNMNRAGLVVLVCMVVNGERIQ